MAERMGKERDETTGRFTETVTDEEILDYLTEQNGAGTGNIADHFDHKQPTAYRRLKALEGEGRVTSRRIGGSLLWTPAEGSSE